MIPDIEAMVASYVREQVGGTVVVNPPGQTDSSWVLVTLIAAPQDTTSPVDYLVDFRVQIDCYAGKDPEGKPGTPAANDLGMAVREALGEMPEATFSGAEVTAVRILNDFRTLDSEFKPARARRVLDVSIVAHAVEVVS